MILQTGANRCLVIKTDAVCILRKTQEHKLRGQDFIKSWFQTVRTRFRTIFWAGIEQYDNPTLAERASVLTDREEDAE